MRMLGLLAVLVFQWVAPATAGEDPRTVASLYLSICAGALRDAILNKRAMSVKDVIEKLQQLGVALYTGGSSE